MKKIKFLRRTWKRYSKLGKRRKKKQVWRKPTGRDNKMREKRKGYPVIVSIGYKQNEKLKKKINNKIPMAIRNIQDLKKLKENQIAIIGNIGKKKKIEIANKAKEMKIEIYNMNPKIFLKRNKKKEKKKETKPGKKKIKKEKSKAPEKETKNKEEEK